MYILYTTNIKAFRFISGEILGSVKNKGKLRYLSMEYISQRLDNIRLIEVRAMKKWIAIGNLAGLVIGMVLMSGCTQNTMIMVR